MICSGCHLKTASRASGASGASEASGASGADFEMLLCLNSANFSRLRLLNKGLKLLEGDDSWVLSSDI